MVNQLPRAKPEAQGIFVNQLPRAKREAEGIFVNQSPRAKREAQGILFFAPLIANLFFLINKQVLFMAIAII